MTKKRTKTRARNNGGNRRPPAVEQANAAWRRNITSLAQEAASRRRSRRRLPQPMETDPEPCSICDSIPAGPHELKQLPCGHHHCNDCLKRNISSALATVPFVPAKCCQNLSAIIVHAHAASAADAAAHAALSTEYLDQDKLYCHVPTCSAYIPASQRTRLVGTCPVCAARTCRSCKTKSHFGPCVLAGEKSEERRNAKEQEKANMALLMKLAGRRRWQTCPRCKAVVDKSSGCNHIRCLCGAGFCYRCGKEYTSGDMRVECSCRRR